MSLLDPLFAPMRSNPHDPLEPTYGRIFDNVDARLERIARIEADAECDVERAARHERTRPLLFAAKDGPVLRGRGAKRRECRFAAPIRRLERDLDLDAAIVSNARTLSETLLRDDREK